MSEATVHTPELFHHEGVMEDPAVVRVLRKAKEIETLVNFVGDTTRAERAELLEDLDQMWIDLGYQGGGSVEATGWMTFREDIVEEEDDDSESGDSQLLTQIVQSGGPDDQVTNYYFSTEVMSCGFCFVPEHIVIDNEIVAEQWRVCYEVLMEHPSESVYLNGHADPDRVRFDFANPSPEHARSRLAYYHPEIIDEIDSRVLNCLSAEEAVLSLKKFIVHADETNPHDAMMLSDAKIYLNSIIEFDHELPYEICLRGKCIALQEDRNVHVAVTRPFARLATPQKIRFASFMKTPEAATNKKIYYPCVELYPHEDDSDNVADHIAIPPDTFMNFISIRSAFYES